jgi:hypothetical protein
MRPFPTSSERIDPNASDPSHLATGSGSERIHSRHAPARSSGRLRVLMGSPSPGRAGRLVPIQQLPRLPSRPMSRCGGIRLRYQLPSKAAFQLQSCGPRCTVVWLPLARHAPVWHPHVMPEDGCSIVRIAGSIRGIVRVSIFRPSTNCERWCLWRIGVNYPPGW